MKISYDQELDMGTMKYSWGIFTIEHNPSYGIADLPIELSENTIKKIVKLIESDKKYLKYLESFL